MRRSLAIVAAIAWLALAGHPAADSANEDEARAALEHGEIKPLDKVLEVARKELPGEVVKVELEHEHGHWKYEIKILTAKGERREIEIDATSLRVLEVD